MHGSRFKVILKAFGFVSMLGTVHTSKLSQACGGFAPYSYYLGSSCYIASTTSKLPATAKHLCNDLEGGHLAFILTQTELDAAFEKMSQLSITNMWVGLEREPDEDWAWTVPMGQSFTPPQQPQMILWGAPEPSENTNEFAARVTNEVNGIGDKRTDVSYSYLCQYKESRGLFRRLIKDMSLPSITHIGSLTGDIFECNRACNAVPVCRSYSYNKETKHCITQWTDGTMPGFEPIQAEGYDLFSIGY